jgi:hypothetical protein
MRLLAPIFVGVLAVVSVQAQQKRSCKENPDIVGQCFKIHGRVTIGNGGPQMRIWPVGTDRLLGVLPSENEIIPDNLGKALYKGAETDYHVVDSRAVFGDFEVCPFTKRKEDEMQMVCVESASHLVVRESIH